jgi:adenylate kinase family enzyme
MQRIAVIGNAGGGKSALCRKLSQALDIPLFPIDRMQWKPGWVAAPYVEIQAQHDLVLAQEAWILDGWGPWDLIEQRFQAADTIIFVDHPLLVHYWWSIKRQLACIFTPRVNGPEGCPMLPVTGRLLKMIWRIHYQLRPRLVELIERQRADKQVIHITSPQDLHRFIARVCPPA